MTMECSVCGYSILMGERVYQYGHGYLVCYRCNDKENKMKEIAEVKIKDLKKAYEDGCEDVRSTLKKMYPDVFKDKWVDITEDVEWDSFRFNSGYFWLVGLYAGEDVFNLSGYGGGEIRLQINNKDMNGRYKIERNESGFNLFEKQ